MRRCWVGMLALAITGCGLAEYEARMLDAQQRTKRVEDDSGLLEQPLQIPSVTTKEGGKVQVANAFFRAPKGISATASNEQTPRGGRLYTYVPKADKAALPFVYVELAFGDDRKEFAAEVMQAFTAPGNVQWKEREIAYPGRPATKFNSTEFEDNQYFYSINLVRTANGQAAVCYWMDKATRNSGMRKLQASLESFATDTEANHRRAAFGKGSPIDAVPRGGK